MHQLIIWWSQTIYRAPINYLSGGLRPTLVLPFWGLDYDMFHTLIILLMTRALSALCFTLWRLEYHIFHRVVTL